MVIIMGRLTLLRRREGSQHPSLGFQTLFPPTPTPSGKCFRKMLDYTGDRGEWAPSCSFREIIIHDGTGLCDDTAAWGWPVLLEANPHLCSLREPNKFIVFPNWPWMSLLMWPVIRTLFGMSRHLFLSLQENSKQGHPFCVHPHVPIFALLWSFPLSQTKRTKAMVGGLFSLKLHVRWYRSISSPSIPWGSLVTQSPLNIRNTLPAPHWKN